MPAVHPTWLNIDFVCGRFTSLSGCWRLKLLNNDGWLLAVDSTPTNKSEAVERV